MLSTVVKTIQRPFYWFLLNTTRNHNWQKYRCDVPLHKYGAGSRKKFSWYLEGALGSGAMSLEHMKEWLFCCEYMSDDVLFSERDVWQHPVTFERLRQGDCEDYALWTWRKLVEQGFQTEFVAGWTIHPGEEYRGHAWVLFYREEDIFIFDGVSKESETMIRPLAEVEEWYVPQVSVDHTLTRFVYGGYYSQLRTSWMER